MCDCESHERSVPPIFQIKSTLAVKAGTIHLLLQQLHNVFCCSGELSKSDKITWMCHQSYLSSGLQTCCIARVFGIQCCRSLTNTRKQKSESLCLRCINFDNFSNMRLLRPQTLWKCNTKLLRYRSKIKGQEYFCFNTHILASLHLAENKIIVTCNVLGLISHFSSKCYMDVG